MGVFTIDLSGFGQAVSDSMTSLAPLFFIVAGLVVAAGALSWGIDMLRSWQEREEYEREVEAWNEEAWTEMARENGWLDENGMLNDKYTIAMYGKLHYDDPD